MNHTNTPELPRKITLGDIQAKVIKATYTRVPDTTLTICVLTLENGFIVTGQSACLDLKEFNAAVGEQIAHNEAIDKIWDLEGYLLSQRRYEAGLK